MDLREVLPSVGMRESYVGGGGVPGEGKGGPQSLTTPGSKGASGPVLPCEPRTLHLQ